MLVICDTLRWGDNYIIHLLAWGYSTERWQGSNILLNDTYKKGENLTACYVINLPLASWQQTKVTEWLQTFSLSCMTFWLSHNPALSENVSFSGNSIVTLSYLNSVRVSKCVSLSQAKLFLALWELYTLLLQTSQAFDTHGCGSILSDAPYK